MPSFMSQAITAIARAEREGAWLGPSPERTVELLAAVEIRASVEQVAAAIADATPEPDGESRFDQEAFADALQARLRPHFDYPTRYLLPLAAEADRQRREAAEPFEPFEPSSFLDHAGWDE